MKKLVSFTGICVFAGVLRADNLVFNPGFDMTPWDSGWTITEEGYGSAETSARQDTSDYYSFPQSAKLYAWTGGYDCYALAEMFQTIPPVKSCTCEVYLKGELWSCYGRADVSIQININGSWSMGWYADSWIDTVDTIWTKWDTVYTSSDTIRGIKFIAGASGGEHPMPPGGGQADFWIDDVCISGEEVGVEESEKCKVKSLKLDASPNPFRYKTSIEFGDVGVKYIEPLQIYDLCGRVVRVFPITDSQSPMTKITWDGTDELGKRLPVGIYLAKLITSQENKVLKLILLN